MGNVTSVASAVKAQGDASTCELYELVSLSGEGKLVELMQQARWTKNYTELDAAIVEYVTPYLYNGGKGKHIPITDLVRRRNQDRQKGGIKLGKKKINEDLAMVDIMTEENGTCNGKKQGYRFQCWDLDKRGTVGETILHLCVLNASQILADLAKRLLKHFPAMINDIYSGEEYYGETVLHLAIVNEDPAMVKLLIDIGADCSARVSGNFFTPSDQRASRSDCLDHEWVNLCRETNYQGFVYWGDYPLAFAACLHQEECVRLLLARGANPNTTDANGNMTLHMLVIHDDKGPEQSLENRKMFDVLLNQGARLDIKNGQGLTPLTLAAKLARKEMYDHILEIIREVYWIFGNVTCAAYPLTDIDTISTTGEINANSALNLIVCGKSWNHLNMMDGDIVQLLQKKWTTFARFRFYRRFVLFFCYVSVFVASFMMRPGTDLCAYLNDTSSLKGCGQTGLNRTFDSCYLLRPYRPEDIARMVLEVILVISALTYLYLAVKECHQGFTIFFSALMSAPAKALFLFSVFLVVLMLPCRAVCAYELEDIIGVVAILFTSPYFLFFCRGLRITGPFVVMIYNMIHGDLLRFVVIYSIFLIGFSQAIYIPFRTMQEATFSHQFEVIVGMFSMSVGDFEDLYEHFDSLKSPFNGIVKGLFVVYMIMVTLLLINMLIAMMGRTYYAIRFTEKEWFRQWAKIVLVIEQTLTTEVRKAKMMEYSVALNSKVERALMIRWHHSEREQEELKRKRLDNKISQRCMAMRKQASMTQPNIMVASQRYGQQNVTRYEKRSSP